MFGLRSWPTPIIKPLWPFLIASAITIYGVARIQDAALATPEFAKDPRNPYAGRKRAADGH